MVVLLGCLARAHKHNFYTTMNTATKTTTIGMKLTPCPTICAYIAPPPSKISAASDHI